MCWLCQIGASMRVLQQFGRLILFSIFCLQDKFNGLSFVMERPCAAPCFWLPCWPLTCCISCPLKVFVRNTEGEGSHVSSVSAMLRRLKRLLSPRALWHADVQRPLLGSVVCCCFAVKDLLSIQSTSVNCLQRGNTALHCIHAVPAALFRPLLPRSGITVLLLFGSVAMC